MKNEKLFIPMLLLSYGSVFFSIDLLLTGKASLRESNIAEGYFIYLEGQDAFFYSISFLLISFFLFSYFFYSSNKILKKNNVHRIKVDFIKKIWFFNFLFIIILTLLMNVLKIKVITIFFLLIILFIMVYVAYMTSKINKSISGKKQ